MSRIPQPLLSFLKKKATPVPHARRIGKKPWQGYVLFVLLFGLTACFPGSQFAPLVDTVPLRYETFKQRYEKEYPTLSRPAGSVKEIAEAFMRQYQPGPLPRVFEHSLITDNLPHPSLRRHAATLRSH